MSSNALTALVRPLVVPAWGPLAVLVSLSATHVAAAELTPVGGPWIGSASVDEQSNTGVIEVTDSDPHAPSLAWTESQFPVTPHAPVTVQFEVRAPVEGQAVVVGLSFFDSSGQWLSGQNWDTPVTAGPNWTPVRSTNRAVPAAAATAAVVLGPVAEGVGTSPVGTAEFRGLEVGTGEPWGQSQGLRIQSSGEAVVWFDYPEQPILRDTVPPEASDTLSGEIELVAFRGEFEAFQLGIQGPLTVASVEAEPFDGLSSDSQRAGYVAPSIEIYEVERVFVDSPSDLASFRGWVPDGLSPWSGSLPVESGDQRALWVRVEVPRHCPPGDYRSTIRIRTAQHAELEAPVRMRVVGPALPKAASFPMWVGLPPSTLARYHGVSDEPEQRRSVIRQYLATLAELRLSALDPAAEAPIHANLEGWGWKGGAVVASDGGRAVVVAASGATGDTPAFATPRVLATELFDVNAASGFSVHYSAHPLGSHNAVQVEFEWFRADGVPVGGTLLAPDSIDSSQTVPRTVSGDEIPVGATSGRLGFRAVAGAVRLDDIRLQRDGSGANLVDNGDFERSIDALGLELDTTGFDDYVSYAVDTLGMTAVSVWLPGMAHDRAGYIQEAHPVGFATGAPGMASIAKRISTSIRDHLSGRGWLELAYLYPFDEPAPEAIGVVAALLDELGDLAPGFDRLLTHYPEPELEGAVDLWVPVLSELSPAEVAKRQAQGERVGSYVSCCLPTSVPNLLIDRPPMEARALPLMAEALGLDMMLYWSATHWDAATDGPPTQDPWSDPSTTLISGEWVGNGDGRLLNPPRQPGDGPALTIRAELLRESLEDIDRTRALQNWAASNSSLDPAISALLEVPEDVVHGAAYWSNDPAALWAWRSALAAACAEVVPWTMADPPDEEDLGELGAEPAPALGPATSDPSTADGDPQTTYGCRSARSGQLPATGLLLAAVAILLAGVPFRRPKSTV